MHAGVREQCQNDSQSKRALTSCREEDAREHHEENSNPVVPCDDAEFMAKEHAKNDENPNPEREWSKSKNQERGNPCYKVVPFAGARFRRRRGGSAEVNRSGG